jgi:poly(A) polymerase
VLRLAALLPSDGGVAEAVAQRLRLSNAERDRLAILLDPPVSPAPGDDPPALRRALYRLGPERTRDLLVLAAAGEEGAGADAKGRGEGSLAPALGLVDGWKRVDLPVRGRDLVALGVAPGPAMGRLLAELEAWWEARDYRPDRAACLAEAASLAEIERRARGSA